MAFKKATKSQSRLRMALIGASGSGKTFTALKTATHMAKRFKTKIAFIDSERGSASKYADKFDFDVCELTQESSFSPERYIAAINEAEEAGYGVIIIDSLSHAWMGKGGALEMVARVERRSGNSNTWAAWREVTPIHNQLVDTILASSAHIIVTMRTKTEWVVEEDERGKKKPRKIGTQPVQREGMDYEFDIVCDINQKNDLTVGKTRCSELCDGFFQKPGAEFAEIICNWLTDGVAVKPEEEILAEKMAELGDRADAAVKMLIAYEWLAEGEPLSSISAKNRKTLINKWDEFVSKLPKEKTNGNDEHTADRAAALGIN